MDAAKEWGFDTASWGLGTLVHMLKERQWYLERGRGQTEGFTFNPELFDFEFSLRQVPYLITGIPEPMPPSPVGKTLEQWHTEIEAFYEESKAYIEAVEREQRNLPAWRARPVHMERDVRWLYLRISAHQMTPGVIAANEGLVGVLAVRRAIRGIAKLLDVTLSPGIRKPHAWKH